MIVEDYKETAERIKELRKMNNSRLKMLINEQINKLKYFDMDNQVQNLTNIFFQMIRESYKYKQKISVH